MAQKEFILMADIIGSRKGDQYQVMNEFQSVVQYINEHELKNILSPITITLGDEFQGIIKNLVSALNIILKIEERIISAQSGFKLRYVLLEGEIETPLNTQIAYGMLGSGLTAAREYIMDLKTSKNRFYFNLTDQQKATALNNSFLALQRIIDGWDPKRDYYIAAEFFQHKDYKQVAITLDKERSLIWKREKSLKLEEYFALKQVVNYIAEK